MVKSVRGNRQRYLGIHTNDRKLVIDISEYVNAMLDEIPEELNGRSKTPWNDKSFIIVEKSKISNKRYRELFHTFVMKGMFLCKRGRPNIPPGEYFLYTRVKYSELDKNKKVMNLMKSTQHDTLTLEANGNQAIYWYIKASFAMHYKLKSHT